MSPRRSHPGSFLLIELLIVLAIALILMSSYVGINSALSQKKNKKKTLPVKRLDIEKEWSVLIQKDIRAPLNYRGEPFFSRPFSLEAVPRDKRDRRGVLSVTVYPQGIIKGKWQGRYHDSWYETDNDIMVGEFAGAYCPSDTVTGNAEFRYLGRGDFRMLETSRKTGQTRHITGCMYVECRIDRNKAAVGRMSLVDTDRNVWEFEWEKPAELPTEKLSD